MHKALVLKYEIIHKSALALFLLDTIPLLVKQE